MRPALLEGWARLARRRWRVGALLFVTIAGVGVSFVFLSSTVYRAEAKLRLGEPPPMSGVSPTAGFFGLLRMGGDPFANDLELLASRTLAENVVDDVALHVSLDGPRGWHRDSLFTRLSADRSTKRASFDVAWEDGVVIVRGANRGVVRGPPGEPLSFGGVTLVARPWRAGMPRRVELRTVPHGEATRSLGSRLEIERTRRDANVLRLRFQDGDPGVTRAVVAAAVGRFIALRTEIMRRESGETVDSLRGVAARTRAEVAAAEADLEAMQRARGLVAVEAQATVAIEQYAEVSARLERARVEQRALADALARSSAAEDAVRSWAALLAYPRFLENETVADMLTRLTELDQQRQMLARRRTAASDELAGVVEQIAHLDRSLRTVARDYSSALAEELGALEAQAARMRAQLAAVPSQAIDLGRRQRDLRVLAEMVVITEQRLRQEELRQALTFANVQVIDAPALRDRPVWPRRKLGPAVAVLLAAGTALLGMLVVDRADATVRGAADVRAALKAPVLAVVRRNGATVLSAADLGALLERTRRAGEAAHVGVTDAADGTLARIVVEAVQAAAVGEDGAARGPCVRALPPLVDYAGAAACARDGAVIVAAELGATRLDALARAATLIGEAGGSVAGAVLVAPRARDAAEAWT